MNRIILSCWLLLFLGLSACQPSPTASPAVEPSATTPASEEITPTPEIYIPLKQAVPYLELDHVKIIVGDAVMSDTFPAGCSGQPPACTTVKDGYHIVSVSFKPLDLPEGEMVPYKNVPDTAGIKDETGSVYPYTLRAYDASSRILTLGFEVPATASSFSLQWPGSNDTQLNVGVQTQEH
jgi:hypothetical protein